MAANPRTDPGFEVGLHLRLDDADHPAEPGAQGVIDGEIHEKVSLGIHRRHLFETAEAAAHAGSHNDQGRLFHRGIPPDRLVFDYFHSSLTADRLQGQNTNFKKYPAPRMKNRRQAFSFRAVSAIMLKKRESRPESAGRRKEPCHGHGEVI